MSMVGIWLERLVTLSVLCAMAQAIMPQGSVKNVGKLACHLVLLFGLLSCVSEVWAEGTLSRWLDTSAQQVEAMGMALVEQTEELEKESIAQAYAAYIVDKAAQLGVSCTAQVLCTVQNGMILPCTISLSGPFTESSLETLRVQVEEELGVQMLWEMV